MEFAFVVGPLGAPVVAVLALSVLFVNASPAWLKSVGVALVALTAFAWLTYWYFWGVGFDRANAELDPLQSTENALNAAMLATFAGSVALVFIASVAYWKNYLRAERS